MATATQITLEAYLNSIFHPDMEYVDGELKDRNVGSYEHSRIQALLTAWFGNRESEWQVQVVTGQRTRTSNTNILIPDVAPIHLELDRLFKALRTSQASAVAAPVFPCRPRSSSCSSLWLRSRRIA